MSRKMNGLCSAARPIITPSTPVVSNMRMASAGVFTSPLPHTGIVSSLFTRAMYSQSLAPV